MIVDSSALISILRQEPDAGQLSAALEHDRTPKISAATLVETSIVASATRQVDLDQAIDDAGIEVVPFDAEHASVARQAYLTYGKGSGSRARLNFGDCFSYALAKVTGEPLLFKGDDFVHTDITPAIPAITQE